MSQEVDSPRRGRLRARSGAVGAEEHVVGLLSIGLGANRDGLLFVPVLLGGYGPDVAFIDRALEQTFSRYAVDANRLVVEGFSDGASYALGLGLANGDLFRRIIAFSPRYVPPFTAEGRPSLLISHGTGDEVRPIDRFSHRIVPALQRRDYELRYQEFQGSHEVPADIAKDALTLIRAGS